MMIIPTEMKVSREKHLLKLPLVRRPLKDTTLILKAKRKIALGRDQTTYVGMTFVKGRNDENTVGLGNIGNERIGDL